MKTKTTRIKKLAQVAGRAARAVGRFAKATLGRLAIYGLALSPLWAPAAYVYRQNQAEYETVYQLTVAIAVAAPPFVVMHAAEHLLVTHVSHQADGAICFDVVDQDIPGCIKSAHYYLIKQKVQ